MTQTTPPPRSAATKAVTLLFSLSIAAAAVVQGSSLGCAQTDPEAAQSVRARPAATTRASAPAGQAPPDHEPLIKQAAPTADQWSTKEPPKPPPTRFFGGSKSDIDVWGLDEGEREAFIGTGKSGLINWRPKRTPPGGLGLVGNGKGRVTKP